MKVIEKRELDMVEKLESLLNIEADINNKLKEIENDFRLQMKRDPNYKMHNLHQINILSNELETVQYMINILK